MTAPSSEPELQPPVAFRGPWWVAAIIWGGVAAIVFPFTDQSPADSLVTSGFVGFLFAVIWWAGWAFHAGKLRIGRKANGDDG